MCVAIALGLVLIAPAAASTVSVRVEMVEFAFRPSAIRLAAGRPVRLMLVNQGHIAHQFETSYLQRLPSTVVGDKLRVEAPGLEAVRVEPGASTRLEFAPRTVGRFAFACTIEGHQEAGMRGHLEIR